MSKEFQQKLKERKHEIMKERKQIQDNAKDFSQMSQQLVIQDMKLENLIKFEIGR